MAHGSKSRKRNRERRLGQKRAKRAANAAVYAERMAQGRNTLTARAKRQAMRQKRRAGHPHTTGPCGNIGCARCFPHCRGALP